MPLIEAVCPNCGAALQSNGKNTLFCPYCNSSYINALEATDSATYVPRYKKPVPQTPWSLPGWSRTQKSETIEFFDQLYQQEIARDKLNDNFYEWLENVGILDLYRLLGQDTDKASMISRASDSTSTLRCDSNWPEPHIYLSSSEKRMVADAMAKMPSEKWRRVKPHITASDFSKTIDTSESSKVRLEFIGEGRLYFQRPKTLYPSVFTFSFDKTVATRSVTSTINSAIEVYEKIYRKLAPYFIDEQRYIKLPYSASVDYAMEAHVDLYFYPDGEIYQDGCVSWDYGTVERQLHDELSRFLVQTVKNNQLPGYDEYVDMKKAQLKQAEQIAKLRKDEIERKKASWRKQGLCQYCGGFFNTFFFMKTCASCKRRKDY